MEVGAAGGGVEALGLVEVMGLKDDCLLKIMGYLGLKELVRLGMQCRRLRSLSLCPVAWQHITAIDLFEFTHTYTSKDTDSDWTERLVRSLSNIARTVNCFSVNNCWN